LVVVVVVVVRRSKRTRTRRKKIAAPGDRQQRARRPFFACAARCVTRCSIPRQKPCFVCVPFAKYQSVTVFKKVETVTVASPRTYYCSHL
jgi:hypothetical protein